MKWIKVKSLILKRLFPRLVIDKYCLKTNPDAKYFIPSLKKQLDAIYACPKDDRVDFVKERVWCVVARGELYRNGLWEGLVPGNLWEFEYLLKNTNPVGYSANLPYNRKKLPSFDLIISAMNNNVSYAEFAVMKYLCVMEDIGPELLMECLNKDAFDMVMKTIVEKHRDRAIPFMLVVSGNNDLYKKLFVSILSRDPEYLAEVKEMIREL